MQLCFWALAVASALYSQSNQNNFQSLIQNTTWVVPTSTILAYRYSISGFTPVTDQTVWIIDTYDSGFFFGNAYTAIVNPPNPINYTQKKMLGTITDTGTVYITFIPSGGISFSDLVTGLGTFSKLQGNYTFIMQMNSGTTAVGLSHWSYMVNISENSSYFDNLPGVNQSLTDFLTNF
jgi:hypothetical protein